MKNNLIAGICIACVLTSCTDKEDLVPETVLTLNIDSQFPTSQTDDWVILHNTEGKLIGYKPFESGDSFTFETTLVQAGGKINITTIKRRLENGYDFFSMASHLHVESGQTLVIRNLERSSPPFGDESGEFIIEMSGTSENHVIALSDKNGYSFGGWLSETGVYRMTPSIHGTSSDFLLFVGDGMGNVKHKWFLGVEDLDLYKLSTNDLDAFDHEVLVSFPLTDNIRFHVSGSRTLEPTEYFYECSDLNGINRDSRTSLKLGYLDVFAKHSTWFQIGYSDRSYTYSKDGGVPGSITLPLNADFHGQNTSITNFTYTKNQPFVYRYGVWTLRDLASSPKIWINWLVFSPEGTQRIAEWPDELKTKYPALIPDVMVYESTTFYTEAVPYKDYIDFVFKGVAAPDVASIGVIVK